ncbi:response regulator transcription factor [Pseudocnuella soli]|uniref:response regulator transcription factor n=1 Tax=Pseudocnuella soli TaxID=2502779 RepID=UPI00104FC39F|nr:response regulator transcription factor [Pseudocnuella soli]
MIKLVMIEDNAAYRKALQLFISKVPDFDIVHISDRLTDIQSVVLRTQPDVVILDIDLPVTSGIEGIRLIKDVYSEANILMLTVFEDEEKIFQSVKAGALGYLLKKDPPEKIIDAIRSIHQGESIMNGQIARKILNYFSKQAPQRPSTTDYNLTKRETEILNLLIEGLSYKDIAARCFISLDTVFSHIKKIYVKLKVNSRSEIAARFRL